jgi:hypothetical protein
MLMPLLPRYHRHQEHASDQHAIAQAVANATGADTHQPASVPRATLPGDSRRLRGIPAIGQSVTGATPGSIPHVHGIPEK